MPKDFGQGQVCLRDRDISPKCLSDLVRGPWALLDQVVDLVRPSAIQGKALVDQVAVGGNRLAVAREHKGDVHRTGRRERVEVLDERPAALAEPSRARVIRAFEEI